MEQITSVHNPKIKFLGKLQKSSERKSSGLFITEGLREISLALKMGYAAKSLFLSEHAAKNRELTNHLKEFRSIDIFTVNNSVFEKIAYRENTEGIVGVFQQKQHLLDSINLSKSPLILVMEGIEKPGNIGAMLRTADAVGVDAVLICNSVSDLYNPNVVRSSLGALFTNQIAICTSEEAISWLESNQINWFGASLQTTQNCYSKNFAQSTALVVGSEANGLSPIWQKNPDRLITIPMKGQVDSMNVSVSAAILLFEASRQRMSQ